MIWFLRNIGVRLWIATLFAIPISFYLLPVLSGVFPGIAPIPTCLTLLAGGLLAVGGVMDLTAKKTVTSLIKEGQVWERSGIFKNSEQKYIKALRVYDTFLLWPFFAKKTAQKISGAIARFRLNTAIENEHFNLATTAYLKMKPEDEAVAALWLIKLQQSNAVTSLDQEVLSILAERYYVNKPLSGLIRDAFLRLERKDFTARKFYQQAQQEPVFESADSEKRQAMPIKPEETLQKERYFFEPEKKIRKKIKIGKNINKIAETVIFFQKRGIAILGSVFSFFVLSVNSIYHYLKDHEKVRFYLKVLLMGAVSVWLLLFITSTMSHMFKTKTVETEKEKIEIPVFKPFKIQVAAYLKQAHADQYVEVLKKKEIEASVREVSGGGKTWFVVRVSEFVDKKSAEAYGQKLKQQKIIDDFFVTNN